MTEATLTRDDLIAQRRKNKPGIWDDFMPHDGYCTRCRADIVAVYGERWPTVDPSGCPKCGKSYCE